MKKLKTLVEVCDVSQTGWEKGKGEGSGFRV